MHLACEKGFVGEDKVDCYELDVSSPDSNVHAIIPSVKLFGNRVFRTVGYLEGALMMEFVLYKKRK